VVGLGRIGALTVERLAGFGMTVIAYDPYVSTARAAALGARLVSLDELLAESDFITVHLPKTPETVGLIGAEALRKVKPSVRIINAARGGIVDEQALADALAEGRVAGAGLDVFAKEPCTDSPLFGFDTVVVTPHLGASTDEAQEKAGISVARSVRLALAGELVPDAVNVSGGVIDEDVRPGIPLVEHLGQLFTGLAGATPSFLEIEVRGELAGKDVSVFTLAALKGLFAAVVEDGVSYVNAPLVAAQRGVEVKLTTAELSEEFRNSVTLRGMLPDNRQVSVSGTLTGPKQVPKLISVDGFDMEIPISEHMAFYRYKDRPGVIGVVGGLLGEAGVNIAGMQVARDDVKADCIVALTVDSPIPADVLTRIEEAIGAEQVAAVDLRT
jgi:D-3-phosphoglycerate dehydrogenase